MVRIAVNPDYQGVRICHVFLDIHCTEIFPLQLLSSGSKSGEEFPKGHFCLQELFSIFFVLFCFGWPKASCAVH